MDSKSRSPIQILISDLPSHIILWGMTILSLYLASYRDEFLFRIVSFIIGITMLSMLFHSFKRHIQILNKYFELTIGERLQNKKFVLLIAIFLSALPLFSFFYITHLASLKYSSEFLGLLK